MRFVVAKITAILHLCILVCTRREPSKAVTTTTIKLIKMINGQCLFYTKVDLFISVRYSLFISVYD